MNTYQDPTDQESHYPDPPSQEQTISNCKHLSITGTAEGQVCNLCGLYVPNECGWPILFDERDEDEDEDFHSEFCTCETCIQNYPERSYLLDEDDDDIRDDYHHSRYMENDCS